MLTKKLPVGIEDFEEMRKQDFYYVDKTGLIVDLLAGWGKVNLFTRPRRFGKTLNMSMLKCFFEIGTDKSLFDGLRVSEEKELCEKYMGQYPVVFVSLKDVDGLTFEDAYDMLREIIRKECVRLQFLMDSDALTDAEKEPMKRLLGNRPERVDIKNSLALLCALLEKHYGQKPILLIDEYDVPLDKAYAHGYYEQMIDLIRAMFGAALKTNDSLFFAVLTGCLRVSKESIFTGLNNLMVHSISDTSFDEYFGFTDAEVGKMLADYGMETHHAEARAWYDGYRFGNADVYCPWDVVNYCDDHRSNPNAEPKNYWMNTSGNDVISHFIDSINAPGMLTKGELERLVNGEFITQKVDEMITYKELYSSIDNLWSTLFMTGYLTQRGYIGNGYYRLAVPNREICNIIIERVLTLFRKEVAQNGK